MSRPAATRRPATPRPARGAAWPIVRAARFNAVGAGGFVMQMACLWVFTERLGLHYAFAAAVALEVAILHNFAWHARWTWGDRRGASGTWWRQLWRFNLLHGMTAALALVIVVFLVEIVQAPVMAAAAVSVAACALINFVASDRLVFAAAPAVLLIAAPSVAAGPGPEAIGAFERRDASMAHRMREVADGRAPGWFDGLSPRVARDLRARLLAGEVVIRPADREVPAGSQPCGDGRCHHWAAAVHIPRVTVDDVVFLLQSYDAYHELYDPAVRRSQLVSRDGDRFVARLQLVEKRVVTVVINAEYDVRYERRGGSRVRVRSRSTRLAEVAHAGTAREREKAASEETGYLWRMNTDCLVEGDDDGTAVYCESLSLSRDIPAGLGWIVGPYVTRVPKESLAFTLGRMRAALSGSSGE